MGLLFATSHEVGKGRISKIHLLDGHQERGLWGAFFSRG